MIYKTRGDLVTITDQFVDANGEPTIVASANILIRYSVFHTKTDVILPMVASTDGLTWTVKWDSSVSDPCNVYYNIRSTDGSGVSEDGMFVLKGNRANTEQ